MKKLLLIFMIGIVSVFSAWANAETEYGTASGNERSSSGSGSNAAAGNVSTISIGVYGDLESSIKEIVNSAEFKKAFPGITVTLQPADFGGHHNRLVTQIAAGTGANDIEALENGYLARFVQDGGFTDLSRAPLNAKEAGKDLVSFAMANATTTDGEIIAFPLDVAPAVLYYRKSVCDEAGVRMDNLQSWEAYIEACKKLTVDRNGDGKADQFAITHPSDVVSTLLNGGKGDWFENGDPYEPASRFIAALELAADIRKAGIDADFSPWSGAWINGFKNGDVVTMVSGHWLGGHFKNWMAPDLSGDWRVTWLPGKTASSYGGDYLAIPDQTAEAKKKICFEIIKYLCTNKSAQITMLKTAESFPALTTVYNSPEMDEPIQYYGGQKSRKLYAEILKKIPEQNVSSYDAVAVDIFYKYTSFVVSGELSPLDAYNKMKAEMKAQME